MGLLNVYSFNKTIKPHIAYRFKVTFFYNKGAEEIESLTYYVKSVELPIWNMNTENRQRFGNTQYVIPIFDFGQSTLKIVFMETDKMSVTYFLNGFLFNNIENADMEANLWNNCAPKIIKIKIDELDQSMRNTVVSNIYACHLKRLSSPNFSNLNFGTPIEVEAEFVVRYKLNSIAEEIGEVHSSLPEPETFKEDIFNARTQEEYNKNAALKQYNEAKTKALTTQRLLTQTEINAILMKQKERLNRAKAISADRRGTKLENARKDADKNGRLNDGTFVTAKEKTEYIKKKQAEAKLQEQKIKEEQAYIYDTYGVDVTKIKSVDELSVQLKGKLSDDDAADLVEAITSINETSDELKKIKQDISSANKSRVIELSDDNMDKQYLGKYTDDKSLSSGGQQYATEFADAENQLALLEKRSELIKNNASMEELMELDSQIAAANGISLMGMGGSSDKASTTINTGNLKTGTGYMDKSYTPNLKQINADAKNKGYDLSDPNQATEYIYKYGTADKGLSQCTRGSNLTIQLMAYASDEKAGKDMTGRETYKSGPAANLFDPTKSDNDTIRNMYEKDSTYENMTLNKQSFEGLMKKNMTKSGDFVTFKIEYIDSKGNKKYSQHTVMAEYNDAGELLPYSDFRQKTLLGYSGKNHKITDVHFFSNKQQHS